MSGGIAQLVAIGAQDAHIVGKPEVSFFRSNFKRHTNIAQTVERQVIQGNPSSGGMSTVRFERKGDLLSYVYLAPNDGTQAKRYTMSAWMNYVNKIELLIGGQVIDEHTSTFSQLIAPKIFAQNHAKTENFNVSDPSKKYYPIRFSFCENWQSAIPLIALQYHDVEIRITWGTLPPDVKWECYAHYIYLDTEERTVLSGTPQNMLITQTQRAIASSTRIQEINFNHPVKLLVASTTHSGKLAIADATNKIKLQINGTDVTDYKYVDPHYTSITPYYHTSFFNPNDQQLSGSGESINHDTSFFMYPFCLDTSKLQPTGSLNFSRIDSARLVCDIKSHDADIYGINYNILRIENGMGGLMYSN